MAALPDPAAPSVTDAPTGTRGRDRIRAYVMLTKPRVIELLLVTTVPPMVLAEGEWIDATDLPERLQAPSDPVLAALGSGELSIKKTTRVIEEMLIRRALQKTKGNRTRAAELLEISHRALLYKIKEFGIS